MRQIEPTHITRGERPEWTRTFSDYPADEWTLQYRFRGPGNGFNVAATADGTGFAVSVPGTTTDDMVAGRYLWQAWVTEIADATNIQMIASGFVTVTQGFDAASTAEVETRTAARIAYDAISASLAGIASSDQMEYEISTPAGSRRIKRYARSELVTLLRHYALIVAREEANERMRTTGRGPRQYVGRLGGA
ncbi:MAG: hypothetical protein ABIV21_02560 [Pyrinomonadaceae bacterium]